jgi:acetylornithine/succinyldiaminopimelate/putrescine aminotransferase
MNHAPTTSALLGVYPRLDMTLTRAEGSWLYTDDGRQIGDLYGGHAVCPLGHGHPELNEALSSAHRTLDFFSNSVRLPIQEEAARAVLGGSAHLAHVHFVNSGTEANESAIHIARRKTGRETIVVLENGFAGRTFASLAATGLPAYRKRLGAAPPAHWTRTIRQNDPAAVDAIDEGVAGVLIESVVSLGGMFVPEVSWLQAIERRCREVGALLLFDEVQGGVGRLGTWFGHEQLGVTPDVVTLAKSLGGGFPVGAAVVTPEIGAWATDSELGTTFGGGPMACAMVEATARIIRRDGLMARAREVEARVRSAVSDLPGVEVRGRGALLGVQTPMPAKHVQAALLDRDLLVGTSGQSHTLRLLPAYNIPFDLLDAFGVALREVLHA